MSAFQSTQCAKLLVASFSDLSRKRLNATSGRNLAPFYRKIFGQVYVENARPPKAQRCASKSFVPEASRVAELYGLSTDDAEIDHRQFPRIKKAAPAEGAPAEGLAELVEHQQEDNGGTKSTLAGASFCQHGVWPKWIFACPLAGWFPFPNRGGQPGPHHSRRLGGEAMQETCCEQSPQERFLWFAQEARWQRQSLYPVLL